jgi:hypothetical protein
MSQSIGQHRPEQAWLADYQTTLIEDNLFYHMHSTTIERRYS